MTWDSCKKLQQTHCTLSTIYQFHSKHWSVNTTVQSHCFTAVQHGLRAELTTAATLAWKLRGCCRHCTTHCCCMRFTFMWLQLFQLKFKIVEIVSYDKFPALDNGTGIVPAQSRFFWEVKVQPSSSKGLKTIFKVISCVQGWWLKYCVWNLRGRPPTMFVSRPEGHYSDGAQ